MGNKLTQTDANGRSTVTRYDVMGRVDSIDYPDGTEETFTYWDNDQIHTVIDQHGTTTYTYDNRDRLDTETQPDGTVLDYDYDDAGNRTEVKLTRNNSVVSTTTYVYDDLNRLETVTDAQGITRYTYDDVGNLDTLTYPNGIVLDYDYNSVNQLDLLTTRAANGSIIQSYDYTLDDTGRRRAILEANGRHTQYGLDDLYRLTSETITDAVNGNYSASYQYDWVGNRLNSLIDGVSTTYAYDDNDRLESQGTTTYGYDNNGNQTSQIDNGDVTEYRYDSKNKLIGLEKNGFAVASYTYNHSGIRTGKTENGQTTAFVVDSNRDYAQVLLETNGTSQIHYSYGRDLIQQTRGGQASFYLYDGLGSTRALADSTGAVTDRYDYEAFGEIRNETGNSENHYKFTGEQFDTSLNQYYLRARYYDQSVGRFSSMDTYQGNYYDPVTLHKYLYANVDPSSMTDPSGNFSMGQMMSTVNVLSNLVSATQSSISLYNSSIAGEELSAKDIGFAILSELVGSKVRLFKIASKGCRKGKKNNCSFPVLGGRYNEINKWRKDAKKGGEIHHMPSFYAIKEVKTFGSAPAIWMAKDDHRKTASHSWFPGSSQYREIQRRKVKSGDICGALAMDVDDIRFKFPGKYEAGMLQLKLQLPLIIGTTCAL